MEDFKQLEPELVVNTKEARKTLEKLKGQKLYEIHLPWNFGEGTECKFPDGSVGRIVTTVEINDTRWFLLAGKNKLPKDVYEYYMQMHENKYLAQTTNKSGLTIRALEQSASSGQPLYIGNY